MKTWGPIIVVAGGALMIWAYNAQRPQFGGWSMKRLYSWDGPGTSRVAPIRWARRARHNQRMVGQHY